MVVISSTILMTKEEKTALEFFQKLTKLEDINAMEIMKSISQQLVTQMGEFGEVEEEGAQDNTVKEELSSPYRKKETQIFYDKKLLDRVRKNEDELFDIRKDKRSLQEQVLSLEEENTILKDELAKATGQLETLKHENTDFKKRANIGMIDILELDLKRERELVVDLRTRLDDKQKEYRHKFEYYQEKFDEYRKRISELEEYKQKYDERKITGSFSDNDLTTEFAKYQLSF